MKARNIIARRFRPEAIERARSIRFNRTGIQLIRYEVTGEDQIAFNEVQSGQSRMLLV